MTKAMQHRGPDADGFHFSDSTIYFGHRRLAIIDLSADGIQPMFDVSRRYCLIFNGEIYNYRELKRELTGYPFSTQTDSEVILAAFSKWGIDCLSRLKGMFAFAIWDDAEKSLFIVRDRLGVKPLYYHLSDECLIFASEVKSLLSSGLVRKKISADALYEYFSFQSIGVPGALIENVKQLRPGCFLHVTHDSSRETKYWDLQSVRPKHDYSDIAEVRNNVRELLQKSVEQRLISDVPVGAFLSGGIDSTAIVALMAQVSSTRPNTFTASFDEQQYDESPYAQMIADKFNTHHTSVKLRSKDFLAEILNGLNAMDSPSGDGINTYVISKAIKQSGITVALSGLGGDELFAGYPTFRIWSQLRSVNSLWKNSAAVRKLGSQLTRLKRSSRSQRLGELLEKKSITIPNIYPGLRRVFPSSHLSHLLSSSLPAATTFETELIRDTQELVEFPVISQMTIAELKGYTLNTLLKDTDQMSMAVSLEIREPFFDHELIEYVLHVPDSHKKGSYPKSLLVDSLGDLLPKEIVLRKKQGFLFPWAIWLRTDLRSFAETQIRNLAKRDFINGKELIVLWNNFIDGKGVRWTDVWLFIVLGYWLDHNGIDA
jgi:asparagine synthase (glutamine-hydrolysing)